MTFSQAKQLCEGDEVLIIEKSGKNPIYRTEHVAEITVEDKDVFIRCADGRLYHHTALKHN